MLDSCSGPHLCILIPDPIPVRDLKLIGLATSRVEFRNREAEIRKALADLKLPPELAALVHDRLSTDPCGALALVEAGRGELYVVDPDRDYCFRFNPEAITKDIPGFDLPTTILRGRLTLVRTMMFHDSPEVAFDGMHIFVRRKAIERSANHPPSSERQLEEAVTGMIRDARARGEFPTKEEQIARVREKVRKASKRRILEYIKKHQPTCWSKSGRKSSPNPIC